MSDANALLVLLGGFVAFAVIAVLVLYIIDVIATWKMFNKIGEPGWKSLIPIYSSYVLAKHTWKVNLFWIMIGLTVIINLLGQIFQDGGMIYNILLIIVGIALIVLSIKFLHSISKAFGHGAGMTVALFFVPFIAMLVIAFGSSQYIGNQCE